MRLAELHMEQQVIASIGHNNPTPADLAVDAMRDLSAWMAEHPVIETEDDARAAKLLLDRAKGCAGDIEAERDKLVRPLNDEIAAINAEYKAIHNTDKKKPGILDQVVNELRQRLTDFLQREEQRRQREAEEKRRAAELAAQAAAEAEAQKQQAIENASAGELGVDVTQVVVKATEAVNEARKTDWAAQRADRDTNVRIGGGFRKAVSLRTVETLSVTDPIAAIRVMGATENITDAILSAARDYRRKHGSLPAGVSSATTRQV